jgi:cyclic pyranopterin phosphate synthase
MLDDAGAVSRVAYAPASEPTRRRSLPLLGTTRLAAPDPRVPHAGAPAVPPRSVRISVTDRCDYACTYCRPSRNDGYAEGRLLASDWRVMFEGLLRAGVRRVRLTGGEPLLHPQIVDIVAHLATLGIEDLALTTNASQLARLAGPLARAGLHRINVSIDTLDPVRFRAITRGGDLAEVLEGIDAALAAGLTPLKLNTVVLRGVNDDEVERLTLWAWERKMVPRFLEVMRIGEGAKLPPELLVTAAEMRERLAAHVEGGDAAPEAHRGPARYLRARHDPQCQVGFISGTSDTFCASCDRLRVSSTGTLRPCLATEDGVEAAAAARAGDAGAVAEQIARAWTMKPDGAVWKGCTEETAASVSIRAIGG